VREHLNPPVNSEPLAANRDHVRRARAATVRERLRDPPKRPRERLTLASAIYQASLTKRRPSRAEMDQLRQTLVEIVTAMSPVTARQVFYLATVRGLVPKTQGGYDKIDRELVKLRYAEQIPWDAIIDTTRRVRRPLTHDSVADALDMAARSYRKSLWSEAECQVQVWIEKDALAGVIYPVTSRFDVPLYVARGYSSLTFLKDAAEAIEADDRPTYLYQLGDHDPSGVDAARVIQERLDEFTSGADIKFERLAVTEDQIRRWTLPSRPTKSSDTRAKDFEGESVELDAIPPDRLRDLVRNAILEHLPMTEFRRLMDIEAQERQQIAAMVRRMR
jgi:hypothetical protein